MVSGRAGGCSCSLLCLRFYLEASFSCEQAGLKPSGSTTGTRSRVRLRSRRFCWAIRKQSLCCFSAVPALVMGKIRASQIQRIRFAPESGFGQRFLDRMPIRLSRDQRNSARDVPAPRIPHYRLRSPWEGNSLCINRMGNRPPHGGIVRRILESRIPAVHAWQRNWLLASGVCDVGVLRLSDTPSIPTRLWRESRPLCYSDFCFAFSCDAAEISGVRSAFMRL